MELWTAILALVGLLLLVAGGELLVRGASRLAALARISPLVIGLTVVAFGTSAPELAVSVKASLAGQADIALGNVVGSNVFNVLFILGLSALIVPLAVQQQLLRLDVPLLIGVSLLTWLLAADGRVSRLEGAALFAGVLAYTVFAVRSGRREQAAVRQEYSQEFGPRGAEGARAVAANAVLVATGLAALVLGARWLVAGAAAAAAALGLSPTVIGLTIVAAGTSLPEVAASITAARRGERDIAVGNVIGSCLFNLLAVLGLTGLLSPGGIAVAPSLVRFDLPVMAAVAVTCLPLLFTGRRIDRWEGALLLAYYAAYVAYLVLAATEHDALPAFSRVMLWFALPLTALGIVAATIRHARAERRP